MDNAVLTTYSSPMDDRCLDENQLEFWKTNGFLVLEGVFVADEVNSLQREADFILELIINSSLSLERQSRRLDIRKRRNGGMIVRKIQPIIDLSLELAKISADDRLLKPMAELIGETPVLMEEKLNYKQPISEIDFFRVPEDDDCFPIHNDWAYYRYNDYPDTIISSAITLDACHAENGSIKVFPASHHAHVDHLRVRNGLEVPAGSVDIDSAETLTVSAGSIIFFHSKLIHTSEPNQTDLPRRIMIYSHYPESADMGIDIRNGPNRLRESPWEWEYQRRKATGEVKDTFSVNGGSQ